MKNIKLSIFLLLLTFSTGLWANSGIEVIKRVEVSLNSFGTFGIFLMIILSSILGIYFLKDEFSSMLD